MTKEASIIGIILTIAGILLLLLTQFHIVALIYGAIAIIFGIIMIAFNKEDKIEERKDITEKSATKHFKPQKSKK